MCPLGVIFIEQTLSIGTVEERLASVLGELHDKKVHPRIANQLGRTQKTGDQVQEEQMRHRAPIKYHRAGQIRVGAQRLED